MPQNADPERTPLNRTYLGSPEGQLPWWYSQMSVGKIITYLLVLHYITGNKPNRRTHSCWANIGHYKP